MPDKSRILHPDSGDEYFIDEGCHILESWNDAGDGAVSIARARVEPGVRTQLHSLTGIEEIYIVRAGRGMAFAEGRLLDANGRVCATAKGIWRVFWPRPPGH